MAFCRRVGAFGNSNCKHQGNARARPIELGRFAQCLNLTVDRLSKLERGAKHPTGPALVLLNVIRRKGIGAIL